MAEGFGVALRFLIHSLLATLILLGCVSVQQELPVDAVNLEELYNQKSYTPNHEIKTCGWATKGFENIKITSEKNVRYGNKAKGFGVDWLENEPYENKPNWRCITGVIEPISGWDDYPLSEDIIMLSTGHGFDWVIVQTKLGRH